MQRLTAVVICRRPQPGLGYPPAPRARGTRQLAAAVEPPMGRDWYYSLQLEQLGRNLATAGGLELAYRLGRTHTDFKSARHRRNRRVDDE